MEIKIEERCCYYPCTFQSHSLKELTEVCRTEKHRECLTYLTRKGQDYLDKLEKKAS